MFKDYNYEDDDSRRRRQVFAVTDRKSKDAENIKNKTGEQIALGAELRVLVDNVYFDNLKTYVNYNQNDISVKIQKANKSNIWNYPEETALLNKFIKKHNVTTNAGHTGKVKIFHLPTKVAAWEV